MIGKTSDDVVSNTVPREVVLQFARLNIHKARQGILVNHVAVSSELNAGKVKLRDQLDDLFQLRPIPAVAMKIMKASRENDVKVRDLVQIIECDSTISARILSVVNSSIYGHSREVVSMNQAVVVMGFKNLSELAISIASEKVFSSGDAASEFRKKLYEHALGVAAVARLLASRAEFNADAGSAFLAGMLHDVGKLVLLDVALDVYPDLQAGQCGTALIKLEQAVFDMDHTEIGGKFGNKWGLPAAISSAISNHHSCEESSSDSLTRVVRVANEFAKKMGIGQAEKTIDCSETQSWVDTCAEQELEQLQEQALEQFSILRSLLTS